MIRLPSVLALGALVALSLSGAVASTSQGYRGLTARESAGIRGSAPGGCTANQTYFPCTEATQFGGLSANPCWVADNDQAACGQLNKNPQGGNCQGCNGNATSYGCTAGKPWNSICDPSNPSNNLGGCGMQWNPLVTFCVYDPVANTCRCKGVANNLPCASITYAFGPCFVAQ